MPDKMIKGSCLCGDVTYKFTGPIKVFQYCHCTRCQKITGSAHAANIIIDPKQFEWLTGEEQVGRFELPEAKYFASSFCKKCLSASNRLHFNRFFRCKVCRCDGGCRQIPLQKNEDKKQDDRCKGVGSAP